MPPCPTSPCCTSGTETIKVLGCATGGSPGGAALQGATVVITLGGVTYASGTTNSSGQFSFAGVPSTLYGLTISASRFNGYTGTFTYSAGGTVTINMATGPGPAIGYMCCNLFAYPIKTTLTYTDANGSQTLTGSGGSWSVCYSASGTVRSDGTCAAGSAGTTPFRVTFCPDVRGAWAYWGCPQFGPPFTSCILAATGTTFQPINTADCSNAGSPVTLSCSTLGQWPNTCTSFGSLVIGQRQLGSAAITPTVTVSPPTGFACSGSWGAGSCPPVTGGFTITE